MVVKDPIRTKAISSTMESLPAVVQEAVDRVLESAAPALDREEMRPLIARLLAGVADVIEALHTVPTEKILAAPTDREALVRALEAAPPSPPSRAELEVQVLQQQARLRGVLARDRLLQMEGGVVSANRAASLLGASRQTVNTRRNKGTLIGLKLGKQGHVYPVWQFAPPGTLTGLSDVLMALWLHDPWTQTAFLLNENSRLGGRRPLDLLRANDVMPVIEAARAYGEQGGA